MHPSAPVSFLRRGDIGEGDSHHLGRRWRRGQSSFRRSPFRRGVRGIPSQQSGSMNANLEVFTSWATHASSRQRFIGPAAPGMHPSAPVPFLRRGDSREGDSHHLGGLGEGDSHHLGRRWRRGQSSFRRSPFRRGVRGIPSQQSGSMNANLEVFTSWATHASSRQRFIGPAAPGMHPSAPVPFLRRGDSREGDSHHLGGHPTARGMPPSAPVSFLRRGDSGEGDSHHLGAVSGAFAGNNRGR